MASEKQYQYTIYYHPIPFRAQFLRCIFAFKGVEYQEKDFHASLRNELNDVGEPLALVMAPPVLQDGDFYISQTPAIMNYLARKLDLMPEDPAIAAIADATLNNLNDMMNEITCNCGSSMWTQESYDEFISVRFVKWLKIFEGTAQKLGLSQESGYFLGGNVATYADTNIFAAIATLEKAFPPLSVLLRRHMPKVTALVDRLGAHPGLCSLLASQPAVPYCGGQIEESLRSVVG